MDLHEPEIAAVLPKKQTSQNGLELKVSDQTHNADNTSWKYIKLQICVVFAITLNMTHAGITTAFTNMLKGDFDEETVSIFASLSALSTPLGTCLTTLLIDRVGRKSTLLFIQILCIITWIIAAFTTDLALLYSCSVLSGLSRGALTSTCATYVSEIAHSKYRQICLSMLTFFFSVGICVISLFHVLMSYTKAGICLSVYFAALLIVNWLVTPESPHWLAVIKLDLMSAKSSLRKLNPQDEMFEHELRLLEAKVSNITKPSSVGKRMQLIRKPRVYKPVLILVGLICFQQLCFIYPFTAFTLFALPRIGGIGERYKSEIFFLSGAIRLVTSLFSTVLLTKFNQKQMMLVSTVGIVASCLPIIVVEIIRLTATAADFSGNSVLDVVSVVCFLCYMTAGYVGILGMPWTIVFELLPIEVKGLIGPFIVAYGYVFMSFVFKIFQNLYIAVGTLPIFIFISFVTVWASAFIHFLIPETRGKTLAEIENFFTRNK